MVAILATACLLALLVAFFASAFSINDGPSGFANPSLFSFFLTKRATLDLRPVKKSTIRPAAGIARVLPKVVTAETVPMAALAVLFGS